MKKYLYVTNVHYATAIQKACLRVDQASVCNKTCSLSKQEEKNVTRTHVCKKIKQQTQNINKQRNTQIMFTQTDRQAGRQTKTILNL